MFRLAVGVVASLLLLSSAAVASGQGGKEARDKVLWENRNLDNPLARVSQFVVEINLSGKDGAVACNVFEDDLRLSASRPLLDGGLKVAADSKDVTIPILDVSLVVLKTAQCAASVDVSVRELGFLIPTRMTPTTANDVVGVRPASSQRIDVLAVYSSFDTFVHHSTGTLLTGPPLDFGSRVNSKIREAVDQLVTKIKLANQTKR